MASKITKMLVILHFRKIIQFQEVRFITKFSFLIFAIDIFFKTERMYFCMSDFIMTIHLSKEFLNLMHDHESKNLNPWTQIVLHIIPIICMNLGISVGYQCIRPSQSRLRLSSIFSYIESYITYHNKCPVFTFFHKKWDMKIIFPQEMKHEFCKPSLKEKV